jgi:hypothetical protein
MHDFYSIFQIIGTIILGGLIVWSGFVLRPIDSDEDKKAHAKS